MTEPWEQGGVLRLVEADVALRSHVGQLAGWEDACRIAR